MRSAPAPFASRSRRRFVGLGAVALLAVGLSACGSNNNVTPGVDGSATDVKADTVASDVRADIRPDIRPDLQVVDVGNPLCNGTEPTTDFTDPFVIANFDDETDTSFSAFGSGAPISGNTYVGTPISDFTGMNWHVTAVVTGDGTSHFGISWGCFPTNGGAQGGCLLDVSRFKGISFTIKGYAGPDNAMSLSLGRAQNDPAGVNAGCGSCTLPAGSDASAADYCRGPRADFPVAATQKTVTLLWTDFSGGSPYSSIDPHQITGILWIFHDPPGSPDGGADAGDAAADAPMSTSDGDVDGSASDAAMCGADGDVCEAGASAPDAGAAETGDDSGATDAGAPGVGYSADITIDDITLVPF